VVRRNASIHAVRAQAKKETTAVRLSGDNKEYQPKMPPKNDAKPEYAVPKAKKRAQLHRLSTGSLSASLDPLTPTSARGIIIGSDVAFEDSDIALPVNNCTSTVSICRPLGEFCRCGFV
jgi:hypothetical protein